MNTKTTAAKVAKTKTTKSCSDCWPQDPTLLSEVLVVQLENVFKQTKTHIIIRTNKQLLRLCCIKYDRNSDDSLLLF
jgi:hypothetical protein